MSRDSGIAGTPSAEYELMFALATVGSIVLVVGAALWASLT